MNFKYKNILIIILPVFLIFYIVTFSGINHYSNNNRIQYLRENFYKKIYYEMTHFVLREDVLKFSNFFKNFSEFCFAKSISSKEIAEYQINHNIKLPSYSDDYFILKQNDYIKYVKPINYSIKKVELTPKIDEYFDEGKICFNSEQDEVSILHRDKWERNSRLIIYFEKL